MYAFLCLCIVNNASVLSLVNLHMFGKVTLYCVAFVLAFTCPCFALFAFLMFTLISN